MEGPAEINARAVLIEHISLGEASESDAPTLLRLMRAAFQEYDGTLDPPSAAHTETIDSVVNRLSAGFAVLASLAGEAAGFAFYKPQGTPLYFSRLSVLP